MKTNAVSQKEFADDVTKRLLATHPTAKVNQSTVHSWVANHHAPQGLMMALIQGITEIPVEWWYLPPEPESQACAVDVDETGEHEAIEAPRPKRRRTGTTDSS